MSVMSKIGIGTVKVMSKDKFDREMKYQATMNLVKNMVKQGLITADEYAVIDTIFLEKYQPILGTLFSELT